MSIGLKWRFQDSLQSSGGTVRMESRPGRRSCPAARRAEIAAVSRARTAATALSASGAYTLTVDTPVAASV